MARPATVIAALGALALAGVGAALLLVLGGDDGGAPERGPATQPTSAGGDAETPPADSGGATRRRLQQQGSCALFGAVHLAQDDAPAPGRDVVLRDASDAELTVTTTETGEFRFEKLAPGGPYELRVAAAGFAEVRLPGIALDRGEERDVGTLTLAPAVPVEVHVRSCADVPLADAEVQAFVTPTTGRGFDWSKALAQIAQVPVAVAGARTDAQGVARFPGLAIGTWSFAATKSGYAKGGRSGVVLGADGDAEPVVVYLTRGHELTGRVLDQDGAPLAGAQVLGSIDTNPYDLGSAPLRVRATSASDGTYRLSALPTGDVALWAARAGDVPALVLSVSIPDVPAIDIVLAEGGTLQGRVTAGGTGEPVAGATVRAWAGSRMTSAETDAEGHYTLRLGAPGMVQGVQVEKEGWYDTADPQRRVGLQVERGETATRDFELAQAGTVTGVVTGPDGAVPGATVMVMRMAAARGFEQRQATTDAQGRYRVSGLREGTAYAIAWGKGVYTSGTPLNPWMQMQGGGMPEHLTVEIGATGETEHDIAVVAGTSLSGRVETADGEPVGGATVRAWSNMGWFAGALDDVVSGPDGTFRIDGVTPTPQLGLAAAKAGYVSLAGEPLQISADAAPPEVVVRIAKAPVVRGRVTLDGGAPPEDTQVLVSVAPPQDSKGQMLLDPRAMAANALRHPVRADGSYEVVLTAALGRLVVRADAPGHALASSETVTLAAQTAEYTVDVALASAASVEGRVVDAAARAGLAGARIRIQQRRGRQGIDDAMQFIGGVQSRGGRGSGGAVVAVSGADGSFRVGGLAAGDYTLSVECTDHVTASKDVHAPGVGDIEVPLEPELEIRGVIVFPDGSPVAGVQVGASAQEGTADGAPRRGGAGTTSADDGTFALRGLAAGSYTISVSNSWQGRANVLPYDGPTVAAGTRDARIVVREGLQVTGRVVDEAGKPVPSVWIWAMPTKPVAGRVSTNAQAQTDEHGAFALVGLAPDSGPLRVQVNGNSGFGGRAYAPKTLEDVAPGTTGLEIVLSSGLSVEGIVVDEQGQPLGNAWIQLQPERSGNEGPRNSGSGMIGADGRFNVGGLDAGTYRVQIQTWGPGRQQQLVVTGDGTVTAGATGLRLTASRGGVITGVVVDGSGRPVANANVSASGTGNGRSSSARAADDGTFELSGLDTGGVYVVSANQSGYIASSVPDVHPGGSGLRLVLASGVECSGRVLDTDGTPLGGVRLWFRPKDGSSGAQQQTGESDADGSFRIGGFVEGVEYEVQGRVRNGTDRRSLQFGTLVGGRGGVTLQALKQ